MYEVGDKFIIEICEKYRTDVFDEDGEINTPDYLYRIKGFNTLVFDEKRLDRLTNYEDGFIAAFSNAMDKGYEKGLTDAWECVRKITLDEPDGLSCHKLKNIYGYVDRWDILKKYTPQEAINRMKTWEEKQEIKVGDVISSTSGSVAVVQYIDSRGIWLCFGKSCYFTLDHEEQRYWEKTSKHIDLTEIFKALEAEDV